MTTTWENIDWKILERLRTRFLQGTSANASIYWESEADLAAYDISFAQRIGWKWDAVARELRLRGWQPPAAQIIDWGCGTGIATRRILDAFPDWTPQHIIFHDRSLQAAHFARETTLREFPRCSVPAVSENTDIVSSSTPLLLLLSHVINELSADNMTRLKTLLLKADCIIWTEPGSYTESRLLQQIRDEMLQSSFRVVAPCTHQSACGMLNEENRQHWCHHFARPPVEAHTQSHWARFGQMLGIDLRSLPYSFIVLEKESITPTAPAPPDEDWSRVIGRPREYKGYLKLLNCNACSVSEKILQKRDDKKTFSQLRKGRHYPLYRWNGDGDKIKNGQPLDTEGLL